METAVDAPDKEVKKGVRVIFVLGGPGSGKGTQCANIVQQFGYTHLSAGDLLRAEIKSGSENGTMIQNMISEGKIVPSEVTIKLLQRAIEECGNDKFLIDGFPRNEENRAAFESVTGIVPDFVLFFDCSEEEMERRLLSRNQGREDDNIETIRKRFKVYMESTLPVIEHYNSRGKVRKIDAAKPVEAVFEDVNAVFASIDEKDAVCRGAEAVLNILPNSSISVAYHPDFGPHNELLLLELDEKLLPDVLCQRVTLRGQPDEDAVFCTSTKTYAVKFVGTSNSVFLIPPSSLSVLDEDPQYDTDKYKDGHAVVSVIKISPGNMELIEVAPMLDRLKLLLSENPLGLSDLSEIMLAADRERGGSVGLYTWDDLVEQIQASDTELKLGLEALSGVEINGYWRLVDEKCMDSVLNMLLNNAVLCEWSFNALSENEVVNMLESDGFPSQIVIHCLHVYGSKVNESLENECVWKLDERCVCAHFAKEILRGGKMKMEKFLEEWMRKVPSRMRASLDMLEGEILTEKLGIETWVRAFSASSLPYNPRERFSLLFRERSKWEWKDLQPYIRDLRVPGLSSEGLLLKYTRRTQPTLDADPIFSAR